MLKQYLLYDQDGYYIEPLVADLGEAPLPEGVTELNFGHMGRPRFVAGQWVDENPAALEPPKPEAVLEPSSVEALMQSLLELQAQLAALQSAQAAEGYAVSPPTALEE